MKKIGLLLVPMALALSACQNGEKQAGQLFQRAEAAYAAGEYSLAKLQIDSIRTLYPKAFEVRKAGIKLMQQIDLAEQTKTLAYLDSMMTVKQAALDSIKGKFVLEKDTAYQEVGNYFYPTQVVEKKHRPFVLACAGERIRRDVADLYLLCGRKYSSYGCKGFCG